MKKNNKKKFVRGCHNCGHLVPYPVYGYRCKYIGRAMQYVPRRCYCRVDEEIRSGWYRRLTKASDNK